MRPAREHLAEPYKAPTLAEIGPLQDRAREAGLEAAVKQAELRVRVEQRFAPQLATTHERLRANSGRETQAE
jgi:hypothetical protein